MVTDERTRTGHPVPDAVRALAEGVGELAARPVYVLDAPATRETLLELSDLRARLDAYELAVVAHAETVQVGADTGATSTGVWWALATQQRRRSMASLVKLATSVETRWGRVQQGLRGARMNLEQARVVVRALEDLPDDLDPDLVTRAEELLVGYAAIHDPDELARLGAHILSVVAPEVGEETDRKRLEEQERKAAQKQRFTLSFDGHGAAHGRFTVPTAQGRMLEKLVLAFAAPRHVNATTDENGDRRTWVKGRPGAERMGAAFVELIETYPRDSAPKAGGVSGTFIVTTDLDLLRHGTGRATLDDGTEISACQARRLACTARLIPAVLGSKGQVLDLGTAVRLFNPAQVYALHLRDGGCTAQGCDWPPGLCHAHHDLPWALGGPTDLANGRLLCPHHHARAHDPTYAMTTHADNQVTFHRRT